MIKTEITLLANNCVLPFQDFNKEHGLDFVELNKFFAIKSLAEHGLGFLINICEIKDDDTCKIVKRIVYDTGGTNLTYLHNLDVRACDISYIDCIILSHWHYDHTGGLYKVLERIQKKETPIICHDFAQNERFFKRSKYIRKSDLEGKTRNALLPLISSSKIENQEPINLEKIKDLNGTVIFSKERYELFSKNGLKVIATGEIPRIHTEEKFDDFFSLQEGLVKEDNILDDKCLIFEYQDHVILLIGCCHSGIMNTIDYLKKITNKPLSHIIGGFHLADASKKRIEKTIDYLKNFQGQDQTLYLFPVHCSGEYFVQEVNKANLSNIRAYNASVGTTFNL
jgi:7,8-dihydropterin-6-yl-methyl-4-(beta-D-ribofuranosyl)aminobenzene 5'-phosphate synthase